MNPEADLHIWNACSDDAGHLYLDCRVDGNDLTFRLDLDVDECVALCRELIHVAEHRLRRLAGGPVRLVHVNPEGNPA